MAKRFIDTNLFADEYFCELSKEGKLFFIYFITNCDHAGILKLNKKLCEFQTGIKNILTVIEELKKSLVTVNDAVYFMPKFIKFQYPNFPQSNVHQQKGAIEILKKYNLFNEETNSCVRVNEELTNSYVNDNVNVLVKPTLKNPKKIKFQDSLICDKMAFKNEFNTWTIEKLKYYYEAAERYSNEGNKYVDWKAAISAWEKKDQLAGKIIFNKLPSVMFSGVING